MVRLIQEVLRLAFSHDNTNTRDCIKLLSLNYTSQFLLDYYSISFFCGCLPDVFIPCFILIRPHVFVISWINQYIYIYIYQFSIAAASDKVYQLLAQGRWFSPGTQASTTTKPGRHDIAEILLKVALNTKNSNSI